MKKIYSVVLMFGLMLFSDLVLATTAKKLAEEAFFMIEQDPLSLTNWEEARLLIQRAYARDSSESWVAIAQSRLTLSEGYKVGQRHKLKSYDERAVQLARKQAEQAVKNGSDHAMAHVQLAMVQTIQGELRKAWEHLNIADSLDEQSFYPWYLRTVIAIHNKDEAFAKRGFEEIETKIRHDYQRRLLLHERIRLAKLTKNLNERDRLHRAMIDLEPNYAYAWGNYGSFLLAQKRYREAAHYLEKAVSINPYPLAVNQLEEARSKL